MLPLLRNGILTTDLLPHSHQDVIRPDRIEAMRQSLLALLPSQHDASLIAESTNAWAFKLVSPHKPDHTASPASFDMAKIAQSDAIVIGKALLYFSLYMQQLPPDFEAQNLDKKTSK